MREIFGHQSAIDTLLMALRIERMPHAWIFQGPVGVGKCLVAKNLANLILCDQFATNPQLSEYCGTCHSCQLMSNSDQGGHPDFHIIRKELARFSEDAQTRGRKLSSIPVEVLRSYLLDPVNLAPQIGRYKVFVIDEAHLLSEAGQNLLLKTLEEPPPGTYIILIASDASKLLPTVRSRCRILPFGPVPDDQVKCWIDQHADKLPAEQRAWLIRFAQGSLGRAEMAISYGFYDWQAEIHAGLEMMEAGRYPSTLGVQLSKHVSSFAEQWVKDHVNASKDAANKLGAGIVLSIFAQHARDRLGAGAGRCDPANPEAAEYQLTPWLQVIDVLGQVESEIQASINMGLALDHLVSLVYRSFRRNRAMVTASV